MRNYRALTFSSLFAVAACLLLAAPAAAQTECQSDDIFCAELRIGPGRAGVRIGGGRQDPPPPPAAPEPEPPVVIVEPEPEPPPQAQPPVVMVQPAPPPPQVVHVEPAPQRVQVRRRARRRYPYSSLGVRLHLDGIFGREFAMPGGGAAFRIRPNPHFALDIGGALYGGNDYNGLDRVELPLTADAIFFFNPQHRFQFYALIGVGGSWSHAEGRNVHTDRFVSRDYAHLGGSAGIGLEWRISRMFALNLDVRGFIRQRVDGNDEPEFTEREDGAWRSTDTSGGFVGQAGMTFYFGS